MASFYAGLIHKLQHLTVSFLKYTKKTGLTFYQFLEAGHSSIKSLERQAVRYKVPRSSADHPGTRINRLKVGM